MTIGIIISLIIIIKTVVAKKKLKLKLMLRDHSGKNCIEAATKLKMSG